MVGMPIDALRVAAFCVFLASWLALAIAALAGAIPRRRRGQTGALPVMTVPAIVGMLLQSTAALPISLSLPQGSIRPAPLELVATLVLAPLAVGIFLWSQRSMRDSSHGDGLITGGPFAWVRHPMYLAFLAMLLATGLLVSARFSLLVATLLYVAGSELRIAAEEAELENRFPDAYPRYRRDARWRYLPGLR
jgi:protein-S-isoprenylcysteine O-methyltransferase Ste14